MGAGGSPGSRSSSQPTVLPFQEQLLKNTFGEIMPMSQGKPNELSRNMEQLARDQSAKSQGLATQNIQEVAGRTGISGPEVMKAQSGVEESAIQQALKGVLDARQKAAFTALQMIAGLPVVSQKSEAKQEKTSNVLWGLYTG